MTFQMLFSVEIIAYLLFVMFLPWSLLKYRMKQLCIDALKEHCEFSKNIVFLRHKYTSIRI